MGAWFGVCMVGGGMSGAVFVGICTVFGVEVGMTTSGLVIFDVEVGMTTSALAVEVMVLDTPTTRGSVFVGVKTDAVCFIWLELGVCAFTLSELPRGAVTATTVTKRGDKRILFRFLFTSTHHHKAIMF